MPLVTIDEAERMAASLGLEARAQPLGSQQDCNFLLTSGHGAPAGVLKIANPAFSAAEIQAQDAAAEHLAATAPGLRVATRRHGPVTVLAGGQPAIARVLAYLPGGTRACARG